VWSRDEALALVSSLRADGRTIVFTNGVFDLLHPGHVRYLEHARALGDALIVGVNSDRSVRANKGPHRPVTPEGERAEILAALRSVDAVVIFDEDTPLELIEAIRPDVLVKGGTYSPDDIVGAEFVRSYGGRVHVTTIVEGLSTTNVLASAAQGKTISSAKAESAGSKSAKRHTKS